MQHLRRNIALNLVRHASKATSIATQNLPQKVTTLEDRLTKAPNQLFLRKYASATNPQNLPHFPAQPLQETLQKFLKTIVPLLTKAEFDETCKEAENFLNGDGAKLQKILEEEAKKSENWLAERWLKAAYLQYRDPVCVYSSPGMVFPTKKFKTDEEWLKYTAKAIFICLKYKEMVDKKKIPLEKMGKQELDMSQYDKVFGTCRIPGIKEDGICYNPKSENIAVAYKGHWFSATSFPCGTPLHPDLIMKQLQMIINDTCLKEENPIGVLSTNHRDEWGKAYCELIKDSQNKGAIEIIQKSLFTVALDDEVPVKHGVDDVIVASQQTIHGGGSTQNAGNRWMDKTIQLIVNRNGVNGFCYEHSPAEGQPIAIMTDFIIKNLDDKKITESASKDFREPCKLRINVEKTVCEHIKRANANVDKLAKELQMCILKFNSYGREFIKSQKLSPDSYIQMAMQYAFYKLHKVPAPHYESAHLRVYPGGRTETIRSCSSESVDFAKSMIDESCSDEQRVKLLRAAVNEHRQYTQLALQGKGVDRHLLGLKLMAIEKKLPIPKFFSTPGVTKSAHFRLSTSQVASKYEAFMCYGPAALDGYGCCYNPRANDMFFAVSCWLHNKETDSRKFAVTLQESLEAMQDVLSRAGEKPKAKL